jgi:hypothetical protein
MSRPDEDDLDAARGVGVGILFSLALWAIIYMVFFAH